jgi:hypothetical protein
MTTASGMGSWPGTDVRETVRMVRDALDGTPDGPAEGEAGWLPYLPELPDRGPGADIVGRTAGLLVDLPVELQPSGWRFADRPGADTRRTRSLLEEDLDELAEAFDGWTGRLKVQVAGPWTMAASLWLHRGERAIVDAGASRDLVDSLAEGVRLHLADVRRLVPGAQIVLQLDEPSLPAALSGRLPTASGYGVVRGLDPQVALAGLRTVLATAGNGETVIHCCAPGIPLPLLRQTGAGLATDTSLMTATGWEGVAVGIEEGMALYAGCVPSDGSAPRAQDVAAGLVSRWEELGMPLASLGGVVVTPTCGMAGLTPHVARDVQRLCIDTAQELAERALD